MIGIPKSPAAPARLADGVALTQADGLAYDLDPAGHQLPRRRPGSKSFAFDSGVYGHETVKAALKADQHDKCGFCEAVFDANVAGDVEHLRPKGAVVTRSGTRLRPGYYWLAYEWANLLFACPHCNQYKKRNHYPLADETRRARSHHDSIAGEEPLLIDPNAEDPRRCITFSGEVPVWSDQKGATSVRILGLDRPQLLRDRREHLAHLAGYHATVRLLDDDPRPDAIAHVAEARRVLTQAIRPAARFSSAAMDLIDSLNAGARPPP